MFQKELVCSLTYCFDFLNLQRAEVVSILLNGAKLEEHMDGVDKHEATDYVEKVHHTLAEDLNLKLETIQLP